MSRKDILKNIQSIAFDPGLPDYDFREGQTENLLDTFAASAKVAASEIVSIDAVSQLAASYEKVINLSEYIKVQSIDIKSFKSPYELNNIDLVIIDGVWGVAENSAIWVETTNWFRVLPFIGEHLVICIKKDQLVANMHDAYAKIHGRDYGFGVFIAGPSKTADIEQSLVIGAQGPKSLRIVML